MSKREEYEEMLADELREELDRREIEIEPGSGSGKNGRVVKSDMVDALLDFEAAAEVVEDEAGDAVEPAEADAPESEAAGSVEVGDIVIYRDKFSGSAQDARVSGIVDAVEGVVDLAVFAGGGSARRRENVSRGRISGTWEPKEVA